MQTNEGIGRTVSTLDSRITEIKQSVEQLLFKLEQQDKLPWPEMLDNFAVVSGQFNSLLQLLRRPGVGGRDDMSILKTLAVLPVQLSLERDMQLERTTEGRIQAWTHNVVPDYLRTKPDGAIEQQEADLSERGSKESGTRQLNQVNKHIETMLNQLKDISAQYEQKNNQPRRTYSEEDTRRLVRAVMKGDEIVPSEGAQSSPIANGSYKQNPMRGAMKSAVNMQTHPYRR